MKLLVTGFDPFGGQTINPAWEAVKRLPERIGEWDIVKQMVPTVYRQAFETARAAFIHVPFLPEQAGETQPSMTLEEIVRGLTEAIKVLSEE